MINSNYIQFMLIVYSKSCESYVFKKMKKYEMRKEIGILSHKQWVIENNTLILEFAA